MSCNFIKFAIYKKLVLLNLVTNCYKNLLFLSVCRRTCWVCFGTDEDEPSAKFINPCQCRGTTKWVHDNCLQRWFDEKQNGNPETQVFCPQCKTMYIITYPSLGSVLEIIDHGENAVNKITPIMAAGAMVGSLYWSAVTFGAVTVIQVLGHKEGFQVMESADPLFLIVALPTIPLGLILGKMVRWEDSFLRLWRKHSPKWWLLQKLFGSAEGNVPVRQPIENNNQIDFVYATRVLCGALMLPTFATAVGNYFFKKVESPLKRSILVIKITFFFLFQFHQLCWTYSNNLVIRTEIPFPLDLLNTQLKGKNTLGYLNSSYLNSS